MCRSGTTELDYSGALLAGEDVAMTKLATNISSYSSTVTDNFVNQPLPLDCKCNHTNSSVIIYHIPGQQALEKCQAINIASCPAPVLYTKNSNDYVSQPFTICDSNYEERLKVPILCSEDSSLEHGIEPTDKIATIIGNDNQGTNPELSEFLYDNQGNDLIKSPSTADISEMDIKLSVESPRSLLVENTINPPISITCANNSPIDLCSLSIHATDCKEVQFNTYETLSASTKSGLQIPISSFTDANSKLACKSTNLVKANGCNFIEPMISSNKQQVMQSGNIISQTGSLESNDMTSDHVPIVEHDVIDYKSKVETIQLKKHSSNQILGIELVENNEV